MGEKKTGRLKEFYPTECIKSGESFMLERSEQNHIIATEETRSSFASALEEFTEAYHLLREVIEKNKNNSDFTSFIPDFSIYYAADENGDYIEGSTAYIWTAPQNLTVFEKYIDDIRKHPGVYPEHKLFTVLKTVLTLTECVKTLHENGLLHLDIKPGNFGIPKRKGKLLTDSITLFDVNTINSLNGTAITEYGTEGFSAPEMLSRGANNTSDIYSIGCTLFSALIANDEIPTQGYSKKYYTQIEELIDTSKLITASEANSNLFLKHELVTILKKCLAESKGKRYQSCVDLIKDLERALAYLYPAEINARLPMGKQLVILEKELDKKQGVSSYLRFLYHLYKKPLFEFLTNYSETVDVLILGFGNYGQKFLDCCLQVGQILGKKLNVRVVSNDRAEGKRDKDIYLAARPELSKFFSIDGNEVYDPYGSIVFENREFDRNSLKKNKEIALEIVSEFNTAQYVFVALGNDSLNRSVAKAILSVSDGENKCSVNFAYDGERIKGKVYGNPIYMYEDVSAEPLYQDIERMAFNAHLVWESGPNIDLVKARAKFKESYNYNASFSYVIAIKYKLYSFGISMDDTSEAATKYYNKIHQQSNKTKNELVALEHRRWVCEKLVLGWTCNRDLESCLKVKPNDKKAKRHVCLVRSRADSTLNTAHWTPERWDHASKAELEALDDLDRMSVQLHKVYKKAADQMKRESALLDSSMLQLRSIALKDPKASIAFSEWYSCLSLIWDGNDSPVREYDKLKNVLIESLSELRSEDQSTAKVLIKLIDGRFDVILKSLQYTDYKNYDCDFIHYIPYILTHKKDTHLVIPFSCGGNTEMFANVASATVANPSQITYLIHVRRISDVEDCRRALAYVFNYLSEKLINPKLNFVMTYDGDAKVRAAMEGLKAEITDGKAYARIQKVHLEEIEK